MHVPSQMSWLSCVISLGIIGLSLQQKSTLKLGVEPHYLRIQDGRTPASMLCTLRDGEEDGVPLAGCEFSVYTTIIWDLNQGLDSPSRNHTIQGAVVHDKYFGTGLKNGDCGLSLTGLVSGHYYLLHCRVRPAVGGAWIYSVMMVHVDGWTPMQYHLQPSGEVVALPGTDVTLLGSAEHQVDRCDFFPPPEFTLIALNSNITSINTTNYRAWLEGKQCGMTLLAVQPSWSGSVRSSVASYSPSSTSVDFIQLTVATPPLWPPLLTVDSTEAYFRPGDILKATCVMGESLPVSNLTWFLGSNVVRADNWDEATAETTWKDDHEPRGIAQRLLLQLSLQDDGKELKCRAGHLALPSSSLDSRSHLVRVRVGDPCTPNPCGPNSECHVSGGFGLCACLPQYMGRPPSCHPECDVSADCPAEKACVGLVCRDPCPADCGREALCQVSKHSPWCVCPPGLTGDPYTQCEEEPCGRREVEPTLISGGYEAKKGEFPWHAAIFEVQDDATHKLRCGGTLVKPNIVITAAHCFYDQVYNTLTPSTAVKVVLGKLQRSWDADRLDTEVQRFEVEGIFVPEDYRGMRDDYRLDIAVVRLATNATLTRQVNVACVDSGLFSNIRNRDKLETGSVGTVAGWGLTTRTTALSPTLQWIDLPWVDKDTCLLNTRLENRRYITRDKFCAGYVNRSRSVCPGDSGGGLVFLDATSNRHFLRGVVSTSLSYSIRLSLCSSDHYTTFTSVGEHLEWIKTYFIT